MSMADAHTHRESAAPHAVTSPGHLFTVHISVLFCFVLISPILGFEEVHLESAVYTIPVCISLGGLWAFHPTVLELIILLPFFLYCVVQVNRLFTWIHILHYPSPFIPHFISALIYLLVQTVSLSCITFPLKLDAGIGVMCRCRRYN